MNGPAHYLEAEDRLQLSQSEPPGSDLADRLTAEALVHATLALAAACVSDAALALGHYGGMRS